MQQKQRATTHTILMPCKKLENHRNNGKRDERNQVGKNKYIINRGRRIRIGDSHRRQERCLPRRNDSPIIRSVNPRLERRRVRKNFFEILNSLCGHFFCPFLTQMLAKIRRRREQERRYIEALLRTGTLSRRKLLNPLSRAIVMEKPENRNEA